jgi:predicted nucleic acid-binding protein
MKFWDSSAILPLLLSEPGSDRISTLFRNDPSQAVWCLTEVEAISALARRTRKEISAEEAEIARRRLQKLADSWEEVASLDAVRLRAIRLLGTHALRAADALQLAAALVFCDERTESLPFVCLDDRLADAARKERFPVLP